MIRGELCQILVDIEDDRDRDDEDDGIDICSNELLDDIPVHPLDILEWIVFLQRFKAIPRQSFPQQP
jgi:hypothetical protein